MALAGVVLLAVGLVATATAAVQLVRVRRTASRLEDRARDVAERAAAVPPDLVEALGSGDRRVIAVEVLNPFELAGQATWFARPLSVVSPELVRSMVNQRAVSLVRDRTAEFGVVADVRVHRAEAPASGPQAAGSRASGSQASE